MMTRRTFLGSGLFALLAADVGRLTEPPGSGDGKEWPALGETMARRRTVREYRDAPLEGHHVRSLLWAAQGVTDRSRGFRTVPSAGALYPLQLRLFTGKGTVEGLEGGVYLYDPGSGDIGRVGDRDLRTQLAIACLSQTWIRRAPASIVISAVYRRTMKKYGKRGTRYADIEAGCAAQNIFLMAVSLGLAAGIVGAFQDDGVRDLTRAGQESTPLVVMPVGFQGVD